MGKRLPSIWISGSPPPPPLEVFYLFGFFIFYRSAWTQKRWCWSSKNQQHPGGQTRSRAFPQSRSYMYVHIGCCWYTQIRSQKVGRATWTPSNILVNIFFDVFCILYPQQMMVWTFFFFSLPFISLCVNDVQRERNRHRQDGSPHGRQEEKEEKQSENGTRVIVVAILN